MEVLTKLYWLKGVDEGYTTTHRAQHANWESACEWAKKATRDPDVIFVVLEMINPETQEVEYF